MQYGKFVIKTKREKLHRNEIFVEEKKDPGKKSGKHHDKALLRSKRQEEREDFNGYSMD
jgi:hypothetical protein